MQERDLGKSSNFGNKKYVRLTPYKMSADAFIYRLAMVTLCLVSLIGILAICCLAAVNHDVPQALNSLTSASLGALITLFKTR